MEDCEAHRHDLRLKAGMLRLAAIFLVFGVMLLAGEPIKALAQSAPPTEARTIGVLFIREIQDRPLPLSLLDIPPPDDGIAGARLALADNNNTGRFLGQEFRLDVIESAKADELLAEAESRVATGQHFLVLDVRPQTVLRLADALKGKDVLLFNAGAPDENLREEDCRANVLHTSPSRAMLADALAQYLVWKQWRRWFLVRGTQPEDQAFAEAVRRAAKRFGGRIVEERAFSDEGGSRRADGGHEQIQLQIPVFTQNAAAHDVVVLADEAGLFGEYFPFRTWEARPVVGTQGLTATSWHPALEQWGATQFQNRFRRSANRTMRPLDYDAWLAVRSIGEAAARRRSTAFAEIAAYLRSAEFDVAGFKGQKLTFRDWNGQLREPILIATPKIPVSVSPQPGFLHQFSTLDTLGLDRPETKCRL
ncbi:ABC transporter substrate-binding protein [Bosea sp. BIWAKO-01]|uniref:ABC transporter substrate-binding protein n=1 Tax=Bosea sp. BIWAKO-01 TaxID=506668 RepID=UPI001FCDED24|nr:ABC transporter substrate-binding protein [Bosea sp. BIWAKO-01]